MLIPNSPGKQILSIACSHTLDTTQSSTGISTSRAYTSQHNSLLFSLIPIHHGIIKTSYVGYLELHMYIFWSLARYNLQIHNCKLICWPLNSTLISCDLGHGESVPGGRLFLSALTLFLNSCCWVKTLSHEDYIRPRAQRHLDWTPGQHGWYEDSSSAPGKCWNDTFF